MARQPIIRVAQKADSAAVDDFLSQAAAVHRHLDWHSPQDWLGQKTFLLDDDGTQINAILICTPEPTGYYWIRIFATSQFSTLEASWSSLFQKILAALPDEPNQPKIASIAYHEWMINLLEKQHWKICQRIIQLRWVPMNLNTLSKSWPFKLYMRPMVNPDLDIVANIDKKCFVPLWQHSKEVLQCAYNQSSYATVVELNDEIVGFQISTLHKGIAHLARLAVMPKYQGQHIGQAIVQDMLSHFHKPWIREISVNTQHDNDISLNLYEKMGFERTGDSFPIYLYN